ncbi:hypothetical protein GH714_041478 [Hevea brasiliensis]|uniref:Reverse transcriptase Ty1/copia-type domain-containing protein n=1 Tax=Hevea brasiliensis TaxID=3981 RepID=A0A6A6N0P1_HEVBR|nr:hypothetical protein GH714_041478 [Hevea brasiliensis]
MGPLHYFLGIQVLRQPTSLVLSQQKYLEDLLRETNMLTSKPCATPMPTAPTLSKAMGSPHPHPEHYRQVLGSLQYLTLTRPDIAFSVNKLAQFMHSPTDIHWQAVKRLLRYLRELLLLVSLSPNGPNGILVLDSLEVWSSTYWNSGFFIHIYCGQLSKPWIAMELCDATSAGSLPGTLMVSDFSSHHHHQQQPILVSNTNLDAETIQEMNPAASSKKATRSNNKKNRSNMNGTSSRFQERELGKRTGTARSIPLKAKRPEDEKIQGLEKSKHYSQANPNNLEQLGPASSLENGENLGFGSQEMKSPSKMAGEEDQEEPGTYLLQHQMNSVSIIDKFLGLTSAPKSSLIFDLSHNVVVPSGSGADFEDEFSGFPGNWDISDARVQNRRCAMPSMKLSRGNVNVQNPNAIFMATPIAQEYKPSSNFITISNAQEQNLNSLFIPPLNTHEENPSSLFINFSNSNERNPSPTPMTPMDTEGLHSRFRQDQHSCNPNAANNYSSLY